MVVDVKRTSLSMEQIQVMSGLAFALHCNEYYPYDHAIKYTLDGNVMIDEYNEQKFIWVDNTIANTYLLDGGVDGSSYQFQVERRDGYLILHCPVDEDGHSVTVTFKDGMLESIADEPAVKIVDPTTNEPNVQLWFHQNTCYRKANPDEPAEISHGFHTHRNSKGLIHREVKQGPAVYLIENGEHVEGESGYYLNDVWCDEHGVVGRPIKVIPFHTAWYDVPRIPESEDTAATSSRISRQPFVVSASE